ncbi:hypothetical protein GCM10018987_39040 [Streptomyces cremeus]
MARFELVDVGGAGAQEVVAVAGLRQVPPRGVRAELDAAHIRGGEDGEVREVHGGMIAHLG